MMQCRWKRCGWRPTVVYSSWPLYSLSHAHCRLIRTDHPVQHLKYVTLHTRFSHMYSICTYILFVSVTVEVCWSGHNARLFISCSCVFTLLIPLCLHPHGPSSPLGFCFFLSNAFVRLSSRGDTTTTLILCRRFSLQNVKQNVKCSGLFYIWYVLFHFHVIFTSLLWFRQVPKSK